jgi:hypothetical protein
MTTIEVLNKLKAAGIDGRAAEAIIEAFENRDRSWFETQFEKVRGEIKDAKHDMIKWIVGSVLLGAILSHFWH